MKNDGVVLKNGEYELVWTHLYRAVKDMRDGCAMVLLREIDTGSPPHSPEPAKLSHYPNANALLLENPGGILAYSLGF
jgi:hypothetical protein